MTIENRTRQRKIGWFCEIGCEFFRWIRSLLLNTIPSFSKNRNNHAWLTHTFSYNILQIGHRGYSQALYVGIAHFTSHSYTAVVGLLKNVNLQSDIPRSLLEWLRKGTRAICNSCSGERRIGENYWVVDQRVRGNARTRDKLHIPNK